MLTHKTTISNQRNTMNKFQKSQILKLSLMVSFLFITLIIPTMFRSTYLYLMFNLLVLSLGAEAGLASFFSKTNKDKNHVDITLVVTKLVGDDSKAQESKEIVKPKVLLEKCSLDKIMGGTVRVVSIVKKCPSLPRIFFIGNGENDSDETVIEEYEEEEEAISKQELFSKTEMFIGNFYKQLKLQRKDSWNRIHVF